MRNFNYTLAIGAIAIVSLLGATQAMANPPGECRGGNAERSVELLENGFSVTVTSDDADEVARIQTHAQRRAAFEDMSAEEREAAMAERQERRQSRNRGEQRRERSRRGDDRSGAGRGQGPGNGRMDFPREDVDRVIANLGNGVRVTRTSMDPEVAARLIEIGQRMAERQERGECSERGQRGGGGGRR